MVEIRETPFGWAVYVNGLAVVESRDEAAIYDFALAIEHPERWPAAVWFYAQTAH